MDNQAIRTYFFLTQISYDYGLITWKEYIERINCLKELSNIPDFNEFLSDFNFKASQEWGQDTSSDIDLLDIELSRNDNNNQSGILEFKINTQGQHCSWLFHKSDPDDKPSIPHGHGIQVPHYKLDVYRGYIFSVNQGFINYFSRESKKYIKLIWNTPGFREFARESIEYYITYVNRNYNWHGLRGITRPLRLPRLR